MSYWTCDNPREHQRQGERDFERNGRYGYDDHKYHDHFDECNKAYRDGFDEAKREQDRRDEFRREQEECEAAEARRLRAQRRQEREWQEQEEEAQRQQAMGDGMKPYWVDLHGNFLEMFPGLEAKPKEVYKADEVRATYAEIIRTLTLLKEYTYLDADAPELRAQNARCHRAACDLLALLEAKP